MYIQASSPPYISIQIKIINVVPQSEFCICNLASLFIPKEAIFSLLLDHLFDQDVR